MRLSKDSGAIRFNEPDFEIGPDLEKAAFLASSMAKGAKLTIRNDPWCSYSIGPKLFQGAPYSIVLTFNGEILSAVSITNDLPEFGSWCEAKEMLRKQAHDDLINSVWQLPIGPYPWGDLHSEFDRKTGFSSIGLNYDVPGRR